MNPFPSVNVDDWLDLVSYLWIGIVAIAVAAIPAYYSRSNSRKLQEIEAQSKDIRDQVVNGHKNAPPLRADLDRVIQSLDRLVAEVDAVRTDLTDEHAERRSQIRELREDVNARFTALNRRLDDQGL